MRHYSWDITRGSISSQSSVGRDAVRAHTTVSCPVGIVGVPCSCTNTGSRVPLTEAIRTRNSVDVVEADGVLVTEADSLRAGNVTREVVRCVVGTTSEVEND